MAEFDLYYWPGLPGRGEFPRLVLEATGADYRDVARLPESEGGGMTAMQRFLEGKATHRIPFAPPFLVHGDIVVAQAAQISAYVGELLNFAPRGTADQIFARQVALTTADLVAEAHEVHHPVGVGLYYEDQKAEAARRAKEFRENRIPKFLGWYERIIDANPVESGFLVGDALAYPDLGLFQAVEGLRYAFPRRMRTIEKKFGRVLELHERVARHPPIAAYLASARRTAFNENGIFRHYSELDSD